MALRGASKLALTPPRKPDEASTVRRASSLFVLAVAVAATPAGAQAPAAAELWRVAAASLASHPALQVGATSTFWNPGSPNGQRGGAAGIEIVHTSAVLGLSGLLLGGSLPLAGPVRAGLVLGRMQIRDLVRTTTSPDSEQGSIPVFEQFGGAHLAFQSTAVQAGVLLAIHNSRFDIESETGFTLDIGFRARPFRRLTIAAATHLLPVTLTSEPTTDYYAAAEYIVVDRWTLSTLEARLALQYGATYRNSGDLDHTLTAGFTVNEQVHIDATITNESAYGQRQWRPGIALGLRFGRYTVMFSHGTGINDVGGTYRVGLDVEFPR
jgi:hypothetical protein